MNLIKTPIIPVRPSFVKVHAPHELHKEAICVFMALGFFLDTDTYWKDEVCLPAGSINSLDDKGFLIDSKPWFEWYHTPRTISFDDALEEFMTLFETIIKEQVQNKAVILPLSGGLDSRTQAVALSKLPNKVQAYSYAFEGGYPEQRIAKSIADTCGFDFSSFTISEGYLWDVIDDLARINGCYSEFTHPRQMAVLPELQHMDGVFSLGHWGDVLFDRSVPNGTQSSQLLDIVLKKIVKRGGMALATSLWKHWELEGNFEEYLRARVQVLLDKIHIEDVNAKVRAFKSLYWAPRWTSTNLSVFSEAHPIQLPYYDDRMCTFICSIPETYLANRQLQIDYIKQQNKALAKITWEQQKPFNLYSYPKNKSPYNVPYRVYHKLKRELKARIGQPYVQRNWELQFIGTDNANKLEQYLSTPSFTALVSPSLVTGFYEKFLTKNPVDYAHSMSMLLTLAVWSQQQRNDQKD